MNAAVDAEPQNSGFVSFAVFISSESLVDDIVWASDDAHTSREGVGTFSDPIDPISTIGNVTEIPRLQTLGIHESPPGLSFLLLNQVGGSFITIPACLRSPTIPTIIINNVPDDASDASSTALDKTSTATQPHLKVYAHAFILDPIPLLDNLRYLHFTPRRSQRTSGIDSTISGLTSPPSR
jgi:hypothetical protein